MLVNFSFTIFSLHMLHANCNEREIEEYTQDLHRICGTPVIAVPIQHTTPT